MTMSEWSKTRLGNIAETTSGGTPDRKNQAFFGGPIPWVKSGELEDTFINDTEEKITLEGLEASSAKLFPPGTMLMAMYGATVGKTALLKIEAATNQAVCAIFPKSDQARTDFLRYALVYQRPEILKLRYGGAQPNISQQVIRNLAVPVPPIPEQRKIASVLGLVQRAIEQQERLIALTTELKKSLMRKLFTEGLRGEPQKQTEIGPVPESWEVKLLRDCCIVQTGIAKGRKVAASEALTLPYLRVANVQAGHLDLSEMKTITIRHKEKDRYLLRKGDVVLTEGGDFDKLGRGFIWNGEIDECVHQNHIFAVRVDRSQLIPEYFAHLSQSPYGKAYFLSVAHKTTNLACINTTKLKGFPVLIPTLDEQGEIVQVLGTVNAKLTQQVEKRRSLSDLFRTLLHQLMTAQIRIHDVDLSFLEEDTVAS